MSLPLAWNSTETHQDAASISQSVATTRDLGPQQTGQLPARSSIPVTGSFGHDRQQPARLHRGLQTSQNRAPQHHHNPNRPHQYQNGRAIQSLPSTSSASWSSQQTKSKHNAHQSYFPIQNDHNPRIAHLHHQTSKHQRLVSNEEKHYLQNLLTLLQSWNKLTVEALHRNETMPRTRNSIENEVGEFLKRIMTDPPGSQVDLTKEMTTYSETSLVAVCRSASRVQNKSGRTQPIAGITFAEFTRRAREAAAQHRKNKEFPDSPSATGSNPRLPSGSGSSASPRAILLPRSHLDTSAHVATSVSPQSDKGKGKAKGKVRRRTWEDDEDQGNILDMI